MKPKVLITGKLPQSAMDVLNSKTELLLIPHDKKSKPAAILEGIGNAEGLICLLTDRIDSGIIDRAKALRIIANYAVGYNNIDVEAATQRRIAVTNTPDVLTDTTADLTFALLLSVSRRIVEADRFVRQGRFNGWEPMLMLGQDIYRKKLGIIGLGRIGQAVAHRARGFEMDIMYYEPVRLPEHIEKTCHARFVSMDELLKNSDFITIHVPLTSETRYLIGAGELKKMKRTACMINVARGPVIDEKALIDALENNVIAGCGLDVYEREPEIEAGLIGLNNVVLLPHIGSATIETRTKMAMMVVENILALLCRGDKPPNVVNPEIFN